MTTDTATKTEADNDTKEGENKEGTDTKTEEKTDAKKEDKGDKKSSPAKKIVPFDKMKVCLEDLCFGMTVFKMFCKLLILHTMHCTLKDLIFVILIKHINLHRFFNGDNHKTSVGSIICYSHIKCIQLTGF